MVNIGISESHRKAVSDRLNLLLANEYVLYTKTLKYHWNIQGKHFGALHIFFREQYEQLFDIVDLVAERVQTLGFNSYGTLQEFSQKTTLREDPGLYPNDLGMIEILLLDQETVIRQMREDIDFTLESNDIGTNNFLTDLMERHEKMAWMLRAHLTNN